MRGTLLPEDDFGCHGCATGFLWVEPKGPGVHSIHTQKLYYTNGNRIGAKLAGHTLTLSGSKGQAESVHLSREEERLTNLKGVPKASHR